MILINVIVISSKGLITNQVQRLLEPDSSEYRVLKKKFLPKERDTLYDTIKLYFNGNTHQQVVWVETKLKT